MLKPWALLRLPPTQKSTKVLPVQHAASEVAEQPCELSMAIGRSGGG